MYKYSRYLLLAALLGACATPRPETAAGPEELDPVVDAPLEAIWWAIIDVVAEYDLDLQTMDLGRGYIRSAPSHFPDADAGSFWSCAVGGASPRDGVLSIRAVPQASGATRLEVAAVPVADDGRFCTSNGVLERQVTRRVAERWRELKG